MELIFETEFSFSALDLLETTVILLIVFLLAFGAVFAVISEESLVTDFSLFGFLPSLDQMFMCVS